MTNEECLSIYEAAISKCDRFERKGKANPYTSANGHMFSAINKDGELGIRFDKKVQENYFEQFNTSYFISYGAKMNGYILLTEEMLNNEQLIIDLLNESFDYVMSLPAK